VVYGIVLQSASYLLQFIQTHFLNIRREPGDMEVVADYLSQSSHAEIDIVCSVRLSHALDAVLKMLSAYKKEKKKAYKKAGKRVG
jgi:hypothetical protein